MFAYSGTTDAPWTKTIVLCSVASLGDVGITVIVFVTVALAAGTLSWAWDFKWHSYTAAALIATCYSTLTEIWGLASGKWAYTPNMIVVPVLNCGSLAFSAINAAGSPGNLDRGANFEAFRRAADQQVSFLGAAFAVTKSSTWRKQICFDGSDRRSCR